MSEILKHVDPSTLPSMPLPEARIRAAEARLRMDLRGELLLHGSFPTSEEIERMIASIPADHLAKLIAERT